MCCEVSLSSVSPPLLPLLFRASRLAGTYPPPLAPRASDSSVCIRALKPFGDRNRYAAVAAQPARALCSRAGRSFTCNPRPPPAGRDTSQEKYRPHALAAVGARCMDTLQGWVVLHRPIAGECFFLLHSNVLLSPRAAALPHTRIRPFFLPQFIRNFISFFDRVFRILQNRCARAVHGAERLTQQSSRSLGPITCWRGTDLEP